METVITCTKAKDWTNGKGEKVPIYSIGLSDGRGGQSFGKEIPLGTPVSELEIIDKGQYGLGIKWKKAQGGGGFGGGGRRSGNESFALSYAKDLVVGGKVDIKQILPTAEKLYAWLEGKKGAAPTQSAATLEPKQQAQGQQAPLPTVYDDLPF